MVFGPNQVVDGEDTKSYKECYELDQEGLGLLSGTLSFTSRLNSG
jgi:hypothetical protein